MRRSGVLFSMLVLLSAPGGSVAGQTPTAVALSAADTLNVEQARTDLGLLRRALEEAHGGLYRFVAKRDLDARFDALRARLPSPVARSEFIEQLLSLLAVVRVQRFDGARYRREVDSVFRIICDRAARRAILDLRGNSGGDDLYGAFLVSQFTEKSFRYFDRIHVATIKPSFATWKPSTFDELRDGTVPDPAGGFLVTPALHAGVAEQQPAAVPLLGPLVVLMDGFTFSTAADVVAQLRGMGRATFVGEESGGAYEGNTSGLNALIVLPASGLKLKI